MEASDVRRLKDLEGENARLKRMFVELSMHHSILNDVITKKAAALQIKVIDGVHS